MDQKKVRGQFSNSLGFIMAAAGSAIGLGNIWGFPTLTAQNGGAGFVLVYLLLMFLVGFPLLLAEFIIGRHARSNPVGMYQKIKGGKRFAPAGFLGIITIGLVLSFYSIVAGKMLAYFLNALFGLLNRPIWATWVISHEILPGILFTSLFFLFTLWIISAGVKNGIEKWSTRLMPLLLALLVLMTSYVLTLDGAMDGVRAYLLPDLTKVLQPDLLINAMGQAFFSLGLGVGGMVVLASYTSKKENLVRLSLWVTLADLGIAFLAGLLILPAMYVAAANGTPIFDDQGNLFSGTDLIFQVLPSLFQLLSTGGLVLAVVFFLLMSLAALTSSISMMEVPVSYLVDNRNIGRKKAAWITGVVFWVISVAITLNADWLFGLVVTATTQYSQPLLGIVICVFVGWVVDRNTIINELTQGNPNIADSLFMKIWSIFIKYVTPILILLVFINSLFG